VPKSNPAVTGLFTYSSVCVVTTHVRQWTRPNVAQSEGTEEGRSVRLPRWAW
jgi:hypothetical protein